MNVIAEQLFFLPTNSYFCCYINSFVAVLLLLLLQTKNNLVFSSTVNLVSAQTVNFVAIRLLLSLHNQLIFRCTIS